MVEWNSVAPPPVTTWALSGSSGHGRQWNLPSTRRWKCDLFKSSHWWMVVQVGFLTRLIPRVRKKRVPFVPTWSIREQKWLAMMKHHGEHTLPFEEEAPGYERGTMVVEKPRGTRGTVRYSSECGWTQFVVTSKQRNHRKNVISFVWKTMPLNGVLKLLKCRKGGFKIWMDD